MNINHQNINIDINSNIPKQVKCVAHVNDNNTRFVDATLYNNGQKIVLSSTSTAKAIFVTKGILINENVKCTISNNIIKIPIDKYALKRIIGGTMLVEIVITDGTQVISPAAAFYVSVTDTILNNTETYQDSGGTVPDILKEIEAALNSKIDDKDGSVKTNHIADRAITTNKIAGNAITAAKLYGIDSSPKMYSYNLIYSNGVYQAIEDAKKEIKNDIIGYTKSESKLRFAQGVSAIYDESGNILSCSSNSSFGGGAFSNKNAKTAFIANNVVTIQAGALSGCTNLETVYIDKSEDDVHQGRFYIENGAIPAGANIIYTDSFNGVTANVKAIAALYKKISNLNTDTNNGTNIESGTGTLTNISTSPISIRYANYTYQRTGDFVALNINICIQANHLSGDLIFSGLPFSTQKNFYGLCISDLNNICKWTIDNSSGTTLQISKADSEGWIHGTTEEFNFVLNYKI